MSVGENLEKEIKRSGMNFRELAEKTGLSEMHVCRLVLGKASLNNSNAEKIAGALGISVEKLLGRGED